MTRTQRRASAASPPASAPALAALALAGLAAFAAPAARAEDHAAAARAVKDQIAATFGGVPGFVDGIADAALPGLWMQEMNLEMSTDTALDPKTKALISLAVAAQIPCSYCIWSDTRNARSFGATDQEIAEAVAMAGLTRNFSTILNGMQVDFDRFKAEMAGN